MGYRLGIYTKDKEFIHEIGKFYGYAPYKYTKESFEYLYSQIPSQILAETYLASENSTKEEIYYSIFNGYGGCAEYLVDSETFRDFIELYCKGKDLWCKETGEYTPCNLHTSPEYEWLRNMMDTEDFKYIAWG